MKAIEAPLEDSLTNLHDFFLYSKNGMNVFLKNFKKQLDLLIFRYIFLFIFFVLAALHAEDSVRHLKKYFNQCPQFYSNAK